MRADERVRQVRLLRDQGYTPKEVAHSLGIGSAEAARLVRAAAALARAEAPEAALVGCWISPTWSTGLSLGDHPDWPVHEDQRLARTVWRRSWWPADTATTRSRYVDTSPTSTALE